MPQKILYYMKKGLRDLRRPLVYPVAENMSSERLGHYYFVFDRARLLAGGSFEYRLDAHGLPMIPASRAKATGWHHHPIPMSQFGLAVFHDHVDSRDPEAIDLFLRIADWFVRNAKMDPVRGAIWEIATPFPRYGLRPGWISAMAQGRAASILARAYQATGDENYRRLADDGLRSLSIDSYQGGVRSRHGDAVCFEEYPGNPAPHVLNGMVFALWGVLDLQRVTGAPHLEAVWNQGVEGLRILAPLHDCGFWTRYSILDLNGDRNVHLATRHYHHIHIRQMQVMHKITDEPVFDDLAHRWEGYDRTRNYWRIYANKIRDLDIG